MASPTWYDLLGVERDASAEQIKAAWRTATDRFEPGQGGTQFRMFNEAADVLLDPDKRSAYDAELAAAAPEPEPEPKPEPEPVPSLAVPVVLEEPEPSPAVATNKVWAALTSTLGLAIVAVLAAAAVVLAVVVARDLQTRADVADARTQAMAVAERSLPLLLQYDYRHLDADRAKAKAYMTPQYQAVYDKLMTGLIAGTADKPGGAIKAKTVVTATLLTGAVAVVDAEATKVRVLAFVNQTSVNGTTQGPLLANRLVGTFVKRDGRWLLDGIDPLIFTG
ncbi:MAG: hypothetical protein JWQ74_2047 [Marmoricola sp.]|nr:hypothetical protein [Marmoricola sp.]